MSRAIITAADCKATPIGQGVVAWWDGTYSSVPDGWEIANGAVAVNDSSYTRPNLVDGRFPRATGAAGDIPGGTSGSNAHSHTVASHTHNIEACANAGDTSMAAGTVYAGESHSHTCNTATDVTNTVDHTPPYREGIPIVYTVKPGVGTRAVLTSLDFAASALMPHRIIAGYHGTTNPAGWSTCDGSNVNGIVTPNLLGKYLKGVASTNATPGGVGGTLAHLHNTGHSHETTGTPIGGYASCGNTGWTVTSTSHTHTVGAWSGNTDSAFNDPAYHTLRYICFTGFGPNTAASVSGRITGGDLASNLAVPRGVVLAWAHSEGTPASWGHCDGEAFANGNPDGYSAKPNRLGLFMRHTTNASTDAGATGGSINHSHSTTGHTHSTGTTAGTMNQGSGNGRIDVSEANHYHNTGGANYASLAPGVSHLPPYYEVAWIVRD